jgi:hypothetical protein
MLNYKQIDIEQRIEAGINWMINSGIQKTHDEEVTGGFAAWYDSDKDEYAFIYSEITGYALNLLVSYRDKLNNPAIDASIELATTFLTEKAFDENFGAVKCRYTEAAGWIDNYCTFDNAIVANALLNKYKLDGDEKALSVAKAIVETLMTKLSCSDGCYARYITKEDRFQNDDSKWSTGFGSFHSKLAIPLYNIYDLLKEEKYLKYIENLLKLTTPFQESNGRFITSERLNTTFLHPNLYTVEGFLAASLYINKQEHKEVVNTALEWISTLKLADGGIAGFVNGNERVNYDSPDINSQFLRCLLLSGKGEDNYVLNLINRIVRFQIRKDDNDKKLGGFQMGDVWFYDHEHREMKETKTHINTWATIFSLNALYYIQYKDENPFTIC